jgi:hypothetical protein
MDLKWGNRSVQRWTIRLAEKPGDEPSFFYVTTDQDSGDLAVVLEAEEEIEIEETK